MDTHLVTGSARFSFNAFPNIENLNSFFSSFYGYSDFSLYGSFKNIKLIALRMIPKIPIQLYIALHPNLWINSTDIEDKPEPI